MRGQASRLRRHGERRLWNEEADHRQAQWRLKANVLLACATALTIVMVVVLGRPVQQWQWLDTCLDEGGKVDAVRCSAAFLDEWSLTHLSAGMLFFW